MSGPSDLRAIAATGDALQTRFRTYAEFVAALRALVAEADASAAQCRDRAAGQSTQALRIEEAEVDILQALRRLGRAKDELRRQAAAGP